MTKISSTEMVGQRIEPRLNDEIAESVKITMKALKEFYGLRSRSKDAALRQIGSEFGHIVARNISSSNNPEEVLSQIASFWNKYGLGEMEIDNGDGKRASPVTFSLDDCYDCIGASAGEVLCAFKEGFVNAILTDRTGNIGSVNEIECCGSGAERCRFQVLTS
ncbi:MAG TPA: V4R domain-containing protein [Candidatus Bathyarchaeia archaeon]|nr:V4R domain-containing protein [Candidatus Bathyarchaeia archaeon]